MTEALFSITPVGKLISARYYTITRETLEKKILSDELLLEVLRRSRAAQVIPAGGPGVIPEGDSIDRCFVKPQHINTSFTFKDLQVEIFDKKYDHKIEFFVSRDIPIGEIGKSGPQRSLYH